MICRRNHGDNRVGHDEVVKSLADVASVEQAPRMESGTMMSVLLTPLKHQEPVPILQDREP